MDKIVTILSAMDNNKKILFVYESKNKAEGPKSYTLTPKWWLSGGTLRLFQAEQDGDNKRFLVSDIKGGVSLIDA